MNVSSESFLVFTIEAGELFSDPEFVKWLNARLGKGLATWHCGGEPSDGSDVFIIYDHGEGDESPWSASEETAMPERLWQKIHELCVSNRIVYGLLRLVNEYP
jgi:hypothetical protein